MEQELEKEKLKGIAKIMADDFRLSSIHAIKSANDTQLIAIKTLFNLAAGGIGLLAVYVTSRANDPNAAVPLIAICLLFVSLVMGLWQLETDKKFYLRHSYGVKNLISTFSLYEFIEDPDEIAGALKEVEQLPSSHGPEIFYYLQIAFFILAAVVFFAPRFF